MCGRFSLSTVEKELLKNRFDLDDIPFDLKPRYNIAPSQDIPIIVNEDHALKMAKWGLIFSWAKDAKFAPINARAESLDEKRAFKNLFHKKRCLILADGFFEWKKTTKIKVPYRIYLKDSGLFSMAGLWDVTKDGVMSCTIITTTPNSLMKPIHNRMPVILEKKNEKKWLKEVDGSLLTPYPANKMEAIQISTLVNSPKNNTMDILKPVKSLAAFQ